MFRITFSPAVRQEIRELREYISRERSRSVADKYIRRLQAFCQELAIAPHRGEQRSGVKLDQRTIGFERRISIVFQVSDHHRVVTIIGIRYAGRELDTDE